MNDDLPDPEARVHSPRSAWTLALRAEVLRVGGHHMARIGHVGVWLGSYADKDGGSCFPGVDTLAALAGYSEESVRALLKVLIGVGMLGRKKRPNDNALYQLLMPVERPDWATHMHHLTDTPKTRASAKRKAAMAAAAAAKQAAEEARNAPHGGFRNPPPAVVPEPAAEGGSETDPDAPEPAARRAQNPPHGGFRNPPHVGGTSTEPPTGVTPTPDTTWFGPRPQPQVARASPLRSVATSPGPAVSGGPVQSPLLYSAPTEPPEQLPEPDTPAADSPPASGLALFRSVREQHPPPRARTDSA